ncbi:unnamed protein product, partial [Mesorhabditis spiculigera]
MQLLHKCRIRLHVLPKLLGVDAQQRGADEEEPLLRLYGVSALCAAKFSDRHGLQKLYQARKKAIEGPQYTVEAHEATAEVPDDLNEILASKATSTMPLAAALSQNVSGVSTEQPVRIPMAARKALRCNECDYHIKKLEFSATTTRYKIGLFARNVIPELRLSRPADIELGREASIFLTIQNHTDSTTQLMIMPDPQEDLVENVTDVIALTMQSYDNNAGVLSGDEKKQETPSHPRVVFTKRNRTGIRLDVLRKDDSIKNVLGLLLKYKNTSSTAVNSDKPVSWNVVRVRITLDV